MGGIIYCAFSTLAISVLQLALKQWRSDLNKDSGEERVTAKSRPMMSLIARMSSYVSSSISVIPVKRSYGSQDPWSSITQKEKRSGRFDIGIDRMKAADYY